MENPSNEQQGALPLEIDVQSTASLLREADDDCLLLDIREPVEVQLCEIEGSRHIPMGQLPLSIDALPKDKRILIYCHHGQRSMMVTQFLRQHGFARAQSVAGGINAWSLEVDPSVPRY